MEYTTTLVTTAGVSVTPGSFFGPSGRGYVRISLGTPTPRVAEAMQRWLEWSRRARRAKYNQLMAIPTTALTAPVVAVTVFPDRARVTRAVRAALTPGVQRLELVDLPLATRPDLVRAGGRGTARAKLLGVATRLQQFQDAPAEAVQQLQKQIQALEDADADILAESGLVEKDMKHLDALAAQSEMFARGLALRSRTLEEQGAFFDFVSLRTRDLQSRLLAIGRQRRELAKELDVLRRQLNALNAAKPKQRYAASVELDVTAAGDFELELTYVVNGAGWEPLYDVRLVNAAIELTYLSQVHQNTGEDWPNVALTLSTARPSLSLVIPELEPWYVRPRPAGRDGATSGRHAHFVAFPRAGRGRQGYGLDASVARAGGRPICRVRCRVRVGRFADVSTARRGGGTGQR